MSPMDDVMGYISIEGRQATVLRVPSEVADEGIEVVPGVDDNLFILFPEYILAGLRDETDGPMLAGKLAARAAMDYLENEDLT
jgi:hypothetical protein